MPALLSLSLVMLAQAAATPQPTPPPASPPRQEASDSCNHPSADSKTIVICTQRPQGYRLNPDVLEAKREMKNPGRPVRPGGKVIPDCTNIGPAPCTQAGVNLIGAALTAAQMAERLAKGEEVGSMFLTDPHPTEYQLYEAAKARREAEEKAQAAAKVKAAAEAKAAAESAAKPSGE